MKLLCPNPKCGCVTGLGATRCPECGESLAPSAMFERWWDRQRNRIEARLKVACPACGQPTPLSARQCPAPGCEAPLTLRSPLGHARTAVRSRWQRFLAHADARTARRVQWIHVLLSAGLLAAVLARTGRLDSPHGWAQELLSLFYLILVGVALPLLLPGATFPRLWAAAASRVKFGLFCNTMTLLWGLHLTVGFLWTHALLLALLVAKAAVAMGVLQKLADPRPSRDCRCGCDFDPSEPQGRMGRFE
jgi:hypothetical protein